MAIENTYSIENNFNVIGGEITNVRYVRALAEVPEPQQEDDAPIPTEESPAPSVDEPEVDVPSESDGDQPSEEMSQTAPPVINEAEVGDSVGPVQKGDKNPHRKGIKSKKLIIAGIALVLLIGVGLGGTYWYYRGRALPNTTVAGHILAGKTEAQVKTDIEQIQANFSVKIEAPKQKVLTPKQADMGLSFDTQKTVDAVISSRRTGSIWQQIAWWHHDNIKLSPAVNEKVLANYLHKNIKTASRNPKDASISFDVKKQTFIINKDVPGSGILVSEAASNITHAARDAKSFNIDVPTQSLPANVLANNLQDTLRAANDYLKPSIRLTTNNTDFVTPTATERASWLSFNKNNQHSLDISTNNTEISAYVSSVSSSYHQDEQKQIAIKKDGKITTVIQAGINGQNVTNQTQIASDITTAFSNHQAYTGVMKVATTKYATQDLNALAKWAYVSLTNQRLTAYQYDKPVNSFLISSGVARFPTEVGVFKVWYKTPNQTMTGGSLAGGDYYNLPNVHWDTYFDGQEAVHEAYWHHNFGHPMSHGCLNATYNDAKWFYDFAPIGTTVVVVS